MRRHYAQFRTTAATPDGRRITECLTCGEHSPATSHPGLLEQWRKAHVRLAQAAGAEKGGLG